MMVLFLSFSPIPFYIFHTLRRWQSLVDVWSSFRWLSCDLPNLNSPRSALVSLSDPLILFSFDLGFFSLCFCIFALSLLFFSSFHFRMGELGNSARSWSSDSSSLGYSPQKSDTKHRAKEKIFMPKYFRSVLGTNDLELIWAHFWISSKYCLETWG